MDRGWVMKSKKVIGVPEGMRAKGGTTVAPEVLIVNEGGGA